MLILLAFLTLSFENNFWLQLFIFFHGLGSAYEVSVSHRRRKQVMQGLAKPHVHLFERVEKSCTSALKSHYENYLRTPQYKKLPDVVRAERLQAKKAAKSSRLCFGF